MTEIKDPADCSTMIEVRAGVDDVDRRLVALMARRFGYMDAAARIKPHRSAVRDEWRKADVHTKVIAEADRAGAPADRLRAVWEELMEQSIAYELDRFDRTRS